MSTKILICQADELINGGRGVRFFMPLGQQRTTAFVVRYKGVVHGFANNCPHMGGELDWDAGNFFDTDKAHLVCATHGALFVPDTGKCVDGPCRGAGLTKLRVLEVDRQIFWLP